MAERVSSGLEGFFPLPRRTPKAVAVPGFLAGAFGEAVFTAYVQAQTSYKRRGSFLLTRPTAEEFAGANFPVNAIVNQIIKPNGFRAATLSDFPQFLEMVDGRYNITANGDLALRSLTDHHNPNNNDIAQAIVELCGIAVDKLARTPALVRGLGIKPANNRYGWTVTAETPIVIYDERLLRKYSGWRFDDIDENGMPLRLSKKKGSRFWYTRDDGVSKLSLWEYYCYLKSDEDLSSSNPNGRVGIVADESKKSDPERINEIAERHFEK